MKKRLMMILVSLVLSIGTVLAQNAIKGTVISSEDGEPVIGATVKVVGTNGGTVTDHNGQFSLSAKAGAQLEVSYVGMLPKKVKASANMKITLDADNQILDEVMVVAYGTQKKSAFTGSAAVLKADDIAKTSNSNPVDALKGKVSGVQINNASGDPASQSFNIRIRGISSINAGNAPLVILDGAPYDGDLNSIANSDIESMTVLKDAASAALYGARGANGVIIITTKKGNQGTSSITVDAKWGSNSRAIPDYEYVTSPARYYEMYYSALNNYAQIKAATPGSNEINTGLGLSPEAAYEWANANLINNSSYGLGYNVYTTPEGQYLIGTNGKLNPNATLGRLISVGSTEYYLTPDSWADEAYRNSLRQEYTVTATANNDKGSFYGSANYLKNEGITKASDFTRFASRLKADYQIRPWLKISGNFNYAHSEANYMAADGSAGATDNIFATRMMAPIYPIYIRDAQGNLIIDSKTNYPTYDYGDGDVIGITRPYLAGANPLSDANIETNSAEGNMFNAVGSAEIRFLKDFRFTTTNSVMLDESRGSSLSQPFYGQTADLGGQVSKSHQRTWAYNYQQLLNWHHVYGKHDAEVMLGHEYYKRHGYVLSAFKSKIYSIFNTELAGAILDGSANSYTTEYNNEGFFGRAQYNYDTKYFASFSYRRDASSRFHPDHRWGNFWSFGGAWNISKEEWFNVSWVDELKFKASYGEQGNDNIKDYLYTNTYSVGNANGEAALIPSGAKGNEDLTWEKGGNFNTGFEFSLFRGRLAGSVEYFYRKTSDMLAWFTLPPSYGFTGYYDNVGNMRNTGVEVELDGTIIRNKDFEWGVNLNFTAYKNKITSMPTENKRQTVDGVEGYSSSTQFYGEGESIYTWYLMKYAGVDPETGVALYWKDIVDKDGNVTGQEKIANASEATYHLCGTALPWAYGGFGTRFSYKGFDLSVDFSYQLGGKAYDSSYAASMAIDRGHIFHKDLENAWTPQNTNTDVPRLSVGDSYSTYSSDRFLTSASYLSFDNLNFGYTLPKSWLTKAGIGSVRVYLSASNLWVWSKRQGLDPRQSISGGTSNAYYSPMRTISGGLTVSF